MRVLVIGASGYVGSRLIPALLEAGHDVVGGFRDPAGADRFDWGARITAVRLDVQELGTLDDAIEDVDAVYYLVHSMAGDDFAAADRVGAQNTVVAARSAGLDRLIYLSGLIPEVPREQLSEHLRSRLEVETILDDAAPRVFTLRAAMLVGSGSTSFEIMRQLAGRLPVLLLPTWMDSTVEPIAIEDVTAALLGALTFEGPGRSYDVGGGTTLSYADLLRRYVNLAGLDRTSVSVPLLPPGLVGQLAGMLTDVPTPTVKALMHSLSHDMVAGDADFRRDLLPPGHRLVGFADAIERSLQLQQDATDPHAPQPGDPEWAGPGTT